MAEDLHLGGMSERTHAGYLRAVRKLADYPRTAPDNSMNHARLDAAVTQQFLDGADDEVRESRVAAGPGRIVN